MEYKTLGKSGLRVSALCVGTMSFGDGRDATGSMERPWTVDDELADQVVREAVEAGVQFFDTADVYSYGSSEEVTGRLVKKYLSRDEAVVATKVFMPMTSGPNGGGLSRKHILAAIDASLERLGMDYVDLYQIHRYDSSIPIEETMGALDEVVRSGKARYIGASSMHAWQFAKAQHAADEIGGTRFISMQNHYNLLYREEEREMIPQCLDMGVGVIPWSPLARGLLAGSRGRGDDRRTERARTDAFADYLYGEHDFDVVDAVEAVAAARGVSMAQIALSWLRTRPGVTAPILGITRIQHLDDGLAALELELTDGEVAQIEAPYRPHPVLGHL